MNIKNNGLIAGGFAHPIKNIVIFTPLSKSKRGGTRRVTHSNNNFLKYRGSLNSNINSYWCRNHSLESIPKIFSQTGRNISFSLLPQGESVGIKNLIIITNAISAINPCIINFFIIYPFGLIFRDCNSLRAKSLNQLPRLIPSLLANSDNCSLNSDWMRIWKVGDSPSPFGDLSLLMVDMYVRILLICSLLRTYLNMMHVQIATPRSAGTLPRRLTTTLYEVTLWLCISLPKLTLNFYGVFSHANNLNTFWLKPLTNKKPVLCCLIPLVCFRLVFVRR